MRTYYIFNVNKYYGYMYKDNPFKMYKIFEEIYYSRDYDSVKTYHILEEIAKEHNIQFETVHINSLEDAKNAPTPITTYALFFNGEYVTNEQMNDKRFLKLISK